MSISEALKNAGLKLPKVAAPLAAYTPAKQIGNQIWTSGQLPMVDGQLLATGKVGSQVDIGTAIECARVCALNGLAAAADVAGGLDNIKKVLKVTAFIASSVDFADQPKIANGASELLGKVFGEAGVHVRSAVGVASLPLDAPVEIELVLEI